MVGYFRVLLFLAFVTTFQDEVVASPIIKIVNGTDAEDGEFPYEVEVRIGRELQCGGSILGSEWILTAGHCIDIFIDNIVYGTNLASDIDPNNIIQVKNRFIHPKFVHKYDVPYYDVGVLQLAEPIPFSKKAQPIKIAEAGQDVPFHTPGVVSGWGRNETYGNIMTHLQKSYLQLLTDKECTDKVNESEELNGFNATHHLCSNDYWNGACFGDSGSPYVINGTQYGIVSWSYEACSSGPSVFTRLSNLEYRDWIRNITNI